MTQDGSHQRLFLLLNSTLNRVTARLARSGRGPFSLIRHVGRRSGRVYETPLILASVPEGCVAELTYGDQVNWYRNVVAAGRCVVVRGADEYRVTSIEPCSAERGRGAFREPFRFVLKVTGRTEFRLLRVNGQGDSVTR